MGNVVEAVKTIIGVGQEELSDGQTCLRDLLVRIGEKRLLGESSPFDIVVAIVLGSVLSRAITDSSAFVPILAAGAVVAVPGGWCASRTQWWLQRSTQSREPKIVEVSVQSGVQTIRIELQS